MTGFGRCPFGGFIFSFEVCMTENDAYVRNSYIFMLL